MKKEQLIKELEEDNKADLKFLGVSSKEYEELERVWLKKETEEFEVVGKIELRKQIIEKLTNNF